MLHLTRLLVAVAECHAVAAELALGADACDGHDIDVYQDTYDTATVRAAFERLAPGTLAGPAAERHRHRPARHDARRGRHR